MKIEKIEIKNYRSLKHLLLDEIGNLTIFIGKNSSGKSNILEAINSFFTEFDADPEREIRNVQRYNWLWHNRIMTEPIEFVITLDIKDEAGEILPEEIVNELGVGGVNELTICRKIIKREDQAVWKTDYVKLNDFFIIKDGAPTIPLETPPENSPETSLDPLVELASSGETPPEASPESIHGPSSEVNVVGTILQNISNAIKGKFKLIQAVRDEKTYSSFGERNSSVPYEIQRKLTSLEQSDNLEDENIWVQFQEYSEKISGTISDIKTIQNKIHAFRRRRKFPLELIGGGDQEALYLLCLLLTEDCILGIEEPEAHLHPELSKNLFQAIRDISKEKQVFITTHSPIFVDRANLENVNIVRMERGETKIKKVKREDLSEILLELGHKPSDILFADKILFVEGETEERVFPKWMEYMGFNLLESGIRVLSVGGQNKGKYHLKMWSEITKDVQVPFFMILDKHAEYEANKIIKEGAISKDRVVILERDCIEDYYPKDKLIEAIKEEFGKELDEEKIEELENPHRAKKLKEILDKPDGVWKPILGEKVAELMGKGDIEEEIKLVIRKAMDKLS